MVKLNIRIVASMAIVRGNHTPAFECGMSLRSLTTRLGLCKISYSPNIDGRKFCVRVRNSFFWNCFILIVEFRLGLECVWVLYGPYCCCR